MTLSEMSHRERPILSFIWKNLKKRNVYNFKKKETHSQAEKVQISSYQ